MRNRVTEAHGPATVQERGCVGGQQGRHSFVESSAGFQARVQVRNIPPQCTIKPFYTLQHIVREREVLWSIYSL